MNNPNSFNPSFTNDSINLLDHMCSRSLLIKVAFCNFGDEINYYIIKQMITLTVIPLSGFYCISIVVYAIPQ